jgi:hypothetical protein
MGDIKSANSYDAWYCIGELLGSKGSGDVRQDEDYNQQIAKEYTSAKEQDFDNLKIVENANVNSEEEIDQLLNDYGIEVEEKNRIKLKEEKAWMEDEEGPDFLQEEVEQDLKDRDDIEDIYEWIEENDEEYNKLIESKAKEEGYKWDDYSGEYYQDKTDYAAHKNKLLETYKNQIYLEKEGLEGEKLLNSFKLGEDGIFNPLELGILKENEELKKILSPYLNNEKIKRIEYTESNTTMSAYLDIYTEVNNYNLAFGDHYINSYDDGEVLDLKPGQIEIDYKIGGANREDQETLKIGTERGGVRVQSLIKAIKQAYEVDQWLE